jgi:hypothetical protein
MSTKNQKIRWSHDPATESPYLVVVRGPVEPGQLLGVPVAVVALVGVPAAGQDALPVGRGADVGPQGHGVGPGGRGVQPALGGAHHAQVLFVFAVVHPPAVVITVAQGRLRALAAHVVHPYGA